MAQAKGSRNRSSLQQHKEMKRKRQMQRKRRLLGGCLLFLVALLYVGISLFYRTHFLPGTLINNIDCSGKTVAQGKVLFEEMASSYALTLQERNDEEETITGEAVGLSVNLGNSLEEQLAEQKCFSWILHLFSKEEAKAAVEITVEEAAFQSVFYSLSCMQEENWIASEDVALSAYTAQSGFTLIPEVYGTEIIEDVLYESIKSAMMGFAESLTLAEAGCYIDPVYTEESSEAQNMLVVANQYASTTITYTFGDDTEIIDGSVNADRLLIDQEQSVSLDEAAMEAYISTLADAYDTKWKSRLLTTHAGTTVEVPSGGNYGWRMNQDETLTALQEALEAGEDYTGEVVWYQTAAQYGSRDYGYTYIEVSISEQHFWYYKSGVVVLDSDFVSGDVANGYDTPTGAYRIAYKARDQVLEGQGYSSPVNYWMPFVEGVGFHDATWREEFGGSIYKNNGSHGCLNLPLWAAAKLYEYVEEGLAVLVY